MTLLSGMNHVAPRCFNLTYANSPCQISGQGPYYGQAAWYTFYQPELPLARARYVKEIQRVIGVLNTALESSKYLVGDKCTYADLMFITWHQIVPAIMGEEKLDIAGTYPKYHAWMESMLARPAVKKVMVEKAAALLEEQAAAKH
jgi:glutathione S-transferase